MSNYQVGMDVMSITQKESPHLGRDRELHSNFNILEVVFPVLLLGGSGLMLFI